MKRILLACFIVGIILLIYILSTNKHPINGSAYFYKDLFGNVYTSKLADCMIDVCFGRKYIKFHTDSPSFTVLTYKNTASDYAKDKNYVYYQDGHSLQADPASFQVYGCCWAKDKDGYFRGNMRLTNYLAKIVPKYPELTNPTIMGITSSYDVFIRSNNSYYWVDLELANMLPIAQDDSLMYINRLVF